MTARKRPFKIILDHDLELFDVCWSRLARGYCANSRSRRRSCLDRRGEELRRGAGSIDGASDPPQSTGPRARRPARQCRATAGKSSGFAGQQSRRRQPRQGSAGVCGWRQSPGISRHGDNRKRLNLEAGIHCQNWGKEANGSSQPEERAFTRYPKTPRTKPTRTLTEATGTPHADTTRTTERHSPASFSMLSPRLSCVIRELRRWRPE